MKRLLSAILGIVLFTGVANAREGKLFRNPKKRVPIYKKVDIDSNRLVVLKGVVDEFSTHPVIAKLTTLDKDSHRPIFFVINSPGGSVVDGFEVIEAIESLQSPLVCIVESEAYSMAALIATYCPTLYMHKFSMIMYHEASYMVQGSTSRVNTRVNMTNRYLDQQFSDVAAQMGLTLAEFKAKIQPEWWMTAKETVASGLADGIIKELQYQYDEPKRPPMFLLFGSEHPDIEMGLYLITSGTKFLAGEEVRITDGFFKDCEGTVTGMVPTKKAPSEYLVSSIVCHRGNSYTTFQYEIFEETILEKIGQRSNKNEEEEKETATYDNR